MEGKTITAVYPGGRATFARSYLASFATLEALRASVVLDGIKGRDAVLEYLFEASHPSATETPSEEPKTAKKRKR